MARPRLSTAREVARVLKVTPATVRRWARAGAIPALPNRHEGMRFDFEAVLAALRANTDRREVGRA